MISEITQKTCTRCRGLKLLDEFHRDKGKKDGRQGMCKPCKIFVVRQWQANNPERFKEYISRYINPRKKELRAWTTYIKQRYGCSNCGEDCPDCLDFHHISDDKGESIANIVTANSLIKLPEEISKCCILCANCHRKYHAGRQVTLGKTLAVTKEDFMITVSTIRLKRKRHRR